MSFDPSLQPAAAAAADTAVGGGGGGGSGGGDVVTPAELEAFAAEMNAEISQTRSAAGSDPATPERAGDGGGGSGGPDPAQVAMLVEMGYAQTDVLTALQVSQNNMEMAVGLLLEGGLDSSMQAAAGISPILPGPPEIEVTVKTLDKSRTVTLRMPRSGTIAEVVAKLLAAGLPAKILTYAGKKIFPGEEQNTLESYSYTPGKAIVCTAARQGPAPAPAQQATMPCSARDEGGEPGRCGHGGLRLGVRSFY